MATQPDDAVRQGVDLTTYRHPDAIARQKAGLKSFKPGQSGNPAGRPKGSRHKITERFLKALAKDFKAHGTEAIVAAREKDPVRYLTIVASCMPRNYEVDVSVSDVPVLIADLRGFQRSLEAEPLEGEIEE